MVTQVSNAGRLLQLVTFILKMFICNLTTVINNPQIFCRIRLMEF